MILCTILPVFAQSQDTSYTRPPVTQQFDVYRVQVQLDPSKKMIELKNAIPTLVYDLRYASANNFMNRRMYPERTNSTFLRKPAAAALQAAQEELALQQLGLKIFDAYRPYSVTVKFWELVRDERYVAHPGKGSGHNRGTSVDLTIINLKTGKELNMGTGFDNFSDTAHHNFTKLSPEILQNRSLLKSIMQKHGFNIYENEWWHYSLPNAGRYELLDLDFKTLKRVL